MRHCLSCWPGAYPLGFGPGCSYACSHVLQHGAIEEGVPCRGGRGRERVCHLDGSSFNGYFLSVSV